MIEISQRNDDAQDDDTDPESGRHPSRRSIALTDSSADVGLIGRIDQIGADQQDIDDQSTTGGGFRWCEIPPPPATRPIPMIKARPSAMPAFMIKTMGSNPVFQNGTLLQ